MQRVVPIMLPVHCRFPGIAVEAFDYVMRRVGQPYAFVVMPNTTAATPYGSMNETSGRWDGFLGAVQSGEVDTVVTDFWPTAARRDTFDFTYPYFTERIYAILPSSREMSFVERQLTASTMLINIFDAPIWVTFAAAMLITVCCATCCQCFSRCWCTCASAVRCTRRSSRLAPRTRW